MSITEESLSRAMADANRPGGQFSIPNLDDWNQVVDHVPEDMTVTVRSGVRLSALQTILAKDNQWVPLDPPHADRLSLQQVMAHNLSGPRRLGYGTVRDHVIGLRVILADGRRIRSGGNVVKNVAGYDLMKLFIGDRATLGLVSEVTFKLLPIPKVEAYFERVCDSLKQAEEVLEHVGKSSTTPILLDLHNQNPEGRPTLVIGFAGEKEDVEWQSQAIASLEFSAISALSYESTFWKQDLQPFETRLSVRPSDLVQTLLEQNPKSYVARAGNGVIYSRPDLTPPRPAFSSPLERRLKDSFDPHHTLTAQTLNLSAKTAHG